MTQRTRKHIEDIGFVASRASDLVGGQSLEAFAADRDGLAAVEWQYVVIGEALSRIRREEPTIYALIPAGEELIALGTKVQIEYDAPELAKEVHAATLRLPTLLARLTALGPEADPPAAGSGISSSSSAPSA